MRLFFTSARTLPIALLGLSVSIFGVSNLDSPRACRAADKTESNVAEIAASSAQAVADSLANVNALRIDNVPGVKGTTPRLTLHGRDARAQLLVTGLTAQQLEQDVTRQVAYSLEPTGLIELAADGLVKPLASGVTTVSVSLPNGVATKFEIEAAGFGEVPPVNFANQIIPIFTKGGCNGGGCHGKAAGQNGFKLSLLGFEPREDFEHLVIESRGRRLFPAAPERSLLLTKATNETPHGGGQRVEKDSHEYRLLVRWIAQGMPYGNESDPVLSSIVVTPAQRLLAKHASQQLSVLATYSDGTTEDITRTVQYESNNTDMASVSPNGLVTAASGAGDVAVMARYQGRVSVFRASLPQGATMKSWPTPQNFVDEPVLAKLQTLGIPMTDVCSDSEFLRRVTLDIAGRLPTLGETREFLSGEQADKRSRAVDRLLDSPDYADNFALKWSAILRNRRPTAGHQIGSFGFHDWIRQSLEMNKPYDQFVREIITASGSPDVNPPVAWFREVSNIESRTEDAAQLFLGQRLQCARCHHHPFEKWAQDDYYHFAAFFSLVSQKGGATPEQPVFVSKSGQPRANNPKNGHSLAPAGLDAQPLSDDVSGDPRVALADWMTAPDNPYFARVYVNRMWKHFFARALVEPEDDMRVTNPASNEELIDALANHFIATKFDMKELVRSICNSRVYQSASSVNDHNATDHTAYSRYYPKRLTAEVLLDALDHITGTTTSFQGMPSGTRAVSLPDTGFSSYFLTVFGRPESTTACECERVQTANLAQSLHLLNSKEVQAKLADDRGRAAMLAADTTRGHAQKVEEIYLLAMSRKPTDEETQTAVAYLEKKQANLRTAYEDLIWAVINSKEFLFNH